ncbi:MAG: ABC transporter ATP-binding protein [Bacteroidales bacterium]|nr:ABC transporter ATP-binding protein [Bacteroidales bacterium]
MKSLRKCLSGLRTMSAPFVWKIIVRVFIGLVRIAASLSYVWVSKALVDVATGDRAGSMGFYVCLFIAVLLLQLASGIGAAYWEKLMTLQCQNSLRYKYFNYVLRSEWNGREARHSGDTLNRLIEDVRVVTELICTKIPEIIVTVCQFIASAIFLMNLAPNLMWVVVIVMVVAIGSSKLFFGKMRMITGKIRESDSLIHQHMQENLQNRVLVLTLFGVDSVLTKMDELQDGLHDDTVKRINYNTIARTLMIGGFMTGSACAFLWGVFGIHSGTVTYGMMTAFLQLVGQVQRPVAELGNQIPSLIQAITSIERLMELSELPGETGEGEGTVVNVPGIRMRNVRFAYPDQPNPVFDGFSCDIAPGSMAVVMGPTGVGKSTLIRLMLALLKPSSGEICLYPAGGDEVPVSPETRVNFTYVPQGNSLISGTIRENLLLAAPDADDSRMEEALRLAAADFVMELPEGLDSRCGESGSGLSEGQSQRIAVARALLHPAGVMIMDEATSALDMETEQLLLENLDRHFKGKKTIVFISHREAVTSMADMVLRLR